MSQAELNSKLIAIVSGNITVFNYDVETREYLSSSVEFLPVGIGIPAHSCIDAPGKIKEGFTVCRTADGKAWESMVDHRGETVYSTETGEAVEIAEVGDYPENTTTLAPATEYDTWNGSEWKTDRNAQHAAAVAAADTQKTMLIATANAAIAPLQDAVDLDIARDDEQSLLLAWKKYRVLLNRIDTSTTPNNEWPTPPAE